MAELAISGLVKRYGDFYAVRDVSLSISDGEFLVLLGPSGCGKTTTLRMVAGFIEPTSGMVRLGGADVTLLPPWKRNAGMVFQSYALFPHLSVAQNVAFGLEMRKLPKPDVAARTREALRLVRLEGFAGRLPRQLSGGQQQRVALARALAIRPDVLLLDEPLSNLDAKLRQEVRVEIRELQRQLGLTTVMVTHDQEEALTMADRIVVMNHGAIEQIGTPQAIYRKPTTAFVADFVGSMNFLAGTLEAPERVRIGSLSLACPPQDGLAVGTAVRLCIRPEDVRVRDLRTDVANRVSVEVTELDFVGAFCRATLKSVDLTLSADFSSNLIRDLGVELGRKLDIALPADRVRVFAA